PACRFRRLAHHRASGTGGHDPGVSRYHGAGCPRAAGGTVFGVPLGVVAATHRGRWQDQVIRFGSLLGYSMPVFWLGLVGLLVFYGKLGLVEGPGRLDVSYDDIVPTVTGLLTIDSLIAGEDEAFWNALSHLVLPASILGYLSLAYVARMTRSFMLG